MFEKVLKNRKGNEENGNDRAKDYSIDGLMNVPEFIEQFTSQNKQFVENALHPREIIKKKDLKFRA